MAAPTSNQSVTASGGVLGWYRRYYLLVNVPLLLLITDIVFARIDLVHHLPFRDPDDLVQAEQRVAAHEASPDRPIVALLGNSALREGLDEGAIERSLDERDVHRTVYNFGLSAGRVRDVVRLLDRLVAAGNTPKAVLLGVNLFLIDDHVNSDSVYPWNERSSPYIYFHRSRFRTSLMRAARYLIASTPKRRQLDAQWTEAEQFRYDRKPSATEYAGFLAQFMEEFGARSPGTYPMIGELHDFIARTLGKGVEVYVVLLPMNPAGTATVMKYRALMAAIREAVPSERTLDLADAFPAEDFYDMGHVNAAGRALLSKRVSDWLAARGNFR